MEIMRYMGFGSCKTAWLMCHKIRTALIEDVEKLNVGARRQAIRGDLRALDRRNVLTCRHKLRIRGYTSTTLLTT
jgi:hypothetical protein